MNAHETYSDCPYWEQLQYLGDTRIQALISYVDFGDDRLARQALDAYDKSRIADGLTQSRYPERPHPGDTHLLAPLDRDAP
jgi:alpha-L-rhamnosidase